jgi:CheY-like chemotaxis protein
MIGEIHRAAERAAALTRQLLAFSRQQVIEPKVLDLNAVVDGVGRMLRRLIGEDIQLATVLSPSIGLVRIDPGQIEQVIMNLAVNARDAMPHGGCLTIETGVVEFDGTYAGLHTESQPGDFVMLAISDTGTGMSPEIRERIFEPFFTTKGMGKGTGLGLAVVHGIVKQSGGNIEVYSETDKGTTFKIYLPIVHDETGESEARVHHPLPRGAETILLVEDEVAVRMVTVLALQSLGYTVLEAQGGEAAIQMMTEHPGEVDLLLSDVVMPEMSGRTLAETLAAQHPELKVLFVSGYTDDAIVRHGVLQAEVAFLQKPFTMGALARKLREVLEGE